MIRRPRPVTYHAEPAPPPPSHRDHHDHHHDDDEKEAVGDEGSTSVTPAQAYLESAQLRHSGQPTVRVVQGINYAETELYRRDAHIYEDPTMPFLAYCENIQQEDLRMFDGNDTDGHTRSRRRRKQQWEEQMTATDKEQAPPRGPTSNRPSCDTRDNRP